MTMIINYATESDRDREESAWERGAKLLGADSNPWQVTSNPELPRGVIQELKGTKLLRDALGIARPEDQKQQVVEQ